MFHNYRFLLTEAKKSLPANRQKQWNPTLLTLFDQQQTYSDKSLGTQEIDRTLVIT